MFNRSTFSDLNFFFNQRLHFNQEIFFEAMYSSGFVETFRSPYGAVGKRVSRVSSCTLLCLCLYNKSLGLPTDAISSIETQSRSFQPLMIGMRFTVAG